jgi:uncharacterized protein YjbI with pentapeptide repeats
MNKDHLKILEKGLKAWNEWRADYPSIKPDLSNAALNGKNFRIDTQRLSAWLNKNHEDRGRAQPGTPLELGIDFSQAKIQRVKFQNANLRDAVLCSALV